MQKAAESNSEEVVPKPRKKHVSHNENIDEPAKLIDEDSVEIERESPSEDNDPVEGIDDGKSSTPPVFEE